MPRLRSRVRDSSAAPNLPAPRPELGGSNPHPGSPGRKRTPCANANQISASVLRCVAASCALLRPERQTLGCSENLPHIRAKFFEETCAFLLTGKVGFIPYLTFPISMLPYGLFAFFQLRCVRCAPESFRAMFGESGFDQAPAGGEVDTFRQ